MWSYKKPKKSGWYYACSGDVVTELSCKIMLLREIRGTGKIVDDDNYPIDDYHDCWKFMPVDFKRLNKIGNE